VESALVHANASYAPALWERIGPRLDAYADAWIGVHTDACNATSVRGEQSAAVLDLRMGCLHRARRDLGAAVALLEHADADVLRRAHVLVDDLPDLARCSDVDALQTDVPPPSASDAEAVAEIEAIVAEAKALRRAGKVHDARAVLTRTERLLATVAYAPVATAVGHEKAVLASDLGEYAVAQAEFRTAIGLAGRNGQWDELAELAGGLSSVLSLHESRPAEALAYIDIADALAARSGDLHVQSSLHSQRGVALHVDGKYAEAAAEFAQAIELGSRESGPDDIAVIALRNNLAIELHHLGRFAEAEAEHRAILEIREAQLGPEHPEVASTHHNLAATLNAEARPEEAITHYREALRIWEQALGTDHPDLGKSRNNLGNVLNHQGRYAEAEAILRELVRRDSETLGADHPQLVPARTNLANALLGLAHYDEAETEYRAVLRLAEKMYGAGHPETAQGHLNVGIVLEATNRAVEAEGEFRQALALYTERLGVDHAETHWARSSLAATLVIQGRHAEAEPELRNALAGLSVAPGADHPETAITHARLAAALTGLARFADADAEYRKALAILEPKGQRHPDLPPVRRRFGGFLRERGELDEARVQLEKAWAAVRDESRSMERAATAFELARVLWAAGERQRARTLATTAERAFADAGVHWRAEHVAAEAWLRAPA
jgi:serine/threonine-protein kinase